jgi:hypothetical protein
MDGRDYNKGDANVYTEHKSMSSERVTKYGNCENTADETQQERQQSKIGETE